MTRLQVHPHCLMFFVDETGHETFADPNYPVFGLGGCAVMAGAVDESIRQPWRALKDKHFGGADRRLHAAALRNPTPDQMNAVGEFFSSQSFGRFAVTMTIKTDLPEVSHPYQIMPGAIRKRWEELASRCRPLPTEIAILHEASERGDILVERYFGATEFKIDDKPLHVHHGFMQKSADEALEVADFIVHAAGRQARAHAKGGRAVFGKDFKSVFHANPNWSSYLAIDAARINEPHVTK